MAKRILITGHLGYIGSVLAPYLQYRGYSVWGLDTGYFDPCTIMAPAREIPGTRIDVRSVETSDLAGFDAVVHLAALSNDPVGNLNPRWTREINAEATARLALCAKMAGVRRFVFSSSCIMYGAASLGDQPVCEESPLDPRTDYARSKVDAEASLRRLAAPGFSPVYLRNGTIYGLSPRMRFDTVLNSLAGSGVAKGKVRVFSDGRPWRPLVHLDDVCAAIAAMLEAPEEAIHNEAFNVGAASMNIQIRDLAQLTAAAAGCPVEVLSSADADQRTYVTSFGKLRQRVPEFAPRWTPAEGAVRLVKELRELKLSGEQFDSPKYTRLRWLRKLLDEDALSPSLEWSARPEAVSA